jgi:hypothetical protein
LAVPAGVRVGRADVWGTVVWNVAGLAAMVVGLGAMVVALGAFVGGAGVASTISMVGVGGLVGLGVFVGVGVGSFGAQATRVSINATTMIGTTDTSLEHILMPPRWR